jgi:hypothetical protein
MGIIFGGKILKATEALQVWTRPSGAAPQCKGRLLGLMFGRRDWAAAARPLSGRGQFRAQRKCQKKLHVSGGLLFYTAPRSGCFMLAKCAPRA